MPSVIQGIGSALGSMKVTNNDIAQTIKSCGGEETSDEWIFTRTGINTRYIRKEETTAQLARTAGEYALADAKMRAEEVSAIIVATVTPDFGGTPSCACMVQKYLNIGSVPAFDINAACTGFIFGLAVADSLIQCRRYKNILVIGSETLSSITDRSDRSLAPLLGDGAGAVVLSRDENASNGIIECYLQSRGDNELLVIPAGGSLYPATHETVEKKMHFLKMNGREVFRFAVEVSAEVIKYFVDKFSLESRHIDWIFLHQANLRITEAVSQRTKIPLEKFYSTIEDFGNTSAASIPLGMHRAYSEGRLKTGDRVLLVGFGGGLTWGGVYLIWEKE